MVEKYTDEFMRNLDSEIDKVLGKAKKGIDMLPEKPFMSEPEIMCPYCHRRFSMMAPKTMFEPVKKEQVNEQKREDVVEPVRRETIFEVPPVDFDDGGHPLISTPRQDVSLMLDKKPVEGNKKKKKMRFKKAIQAISIVMALSMIAIFFVNADEPTITISQDSIVNHVGQEVKMSVHVHPPGPMKAFEFKVRFNSSLYQVESVEEGQIFKGYQTFFSNGHIDNVNGTVINIYDLIVGQGNVTHDGILVNITFICIKLGTSPFELYDVGITDESEYLTITVQNGEIQSVSHLDMNMDGVLDIKDILIIGSHYSQTGNPGWIREDVNLDGRISLKDMLLVSNAIFNHII